MKAIIIALTLSSLGLVACDVVNAEDNCNRFVSDWCDKEVACSQSSKDDCLARFKTGGIDCAKAVDSPSDKCYEDIKALSCPVSTKKVPTSCDFKLSK